MRGTVRGTMRACAAAAGLSAALAGCSTDGGNNPLASRSTTVEYYRVFDIRTDAPAQSVTRAATAQAIIELLIFTSLC